MEKKTQQQGNIILIITIIVLICAFFLANRFILNPLIEKTKQDHLNQIKQMNEQTRKIIGQGFVFNLFSQEQFTGLKEYLTLPLKIENQGNPEPFQQEEAEGCTGYSCAQ